MAVNPDKNIVEQSLIARLIGKIKRIALDISDDVSAEETRATAAEAAAKTEVVQGENCTIEKTTAADGHNVYTINADGKPQVQADWNQADSSKVDYIKNKPNLGLKADKVQGATAGNLAALDANGNLTDSGKKAADFATDEQGAKADTAVQGVKVNGTELSKDGNNVVNVPVPTASTDTPLKDGSASAGSSSQWAKGDHVHPTDTSREAVANKVQSIDDSSTTEYPSSKAVAEFVNSSVATNTATFLGNFSLADLGLTYPATEVQIASALNSHTWPTGYPTNNDYVYVEIRNPQSTIDDKVQRYKYRDGLASWGYEYTLNNSSFTTEEKAAIDSGITSQDVTNLRADHTTLDTHVANTSNPHNVTKSQVDLGNVDNTSDANKPISTAQQIALNAKQNTISDLATIRSGASAGASALQPNGNGSNLSVTPDGTSTGTDLGSSTTLKVWAQKFKNLVGALKALAFKDTVGTSDIADDAITAAKVKDYETLPVNISGTADSASTADKVKNGSNWTKTDSAAPQGLRVDRAYNNGWPYTYGNVITVGGAGDGQLMLGWSGTTGGVAPIYYRNRRDQGGTTWSPWRTIAFQEDNSVSLSGQTLSVKINGTTQSLTNTTYESKSAASGGTDVSLCTTDEKYTWGRKQDTVGADTDSSAFSDNTTIATGFGSNKIHLNAASRLWNYIKDKISSVLGLSESNGVRSFSCSTGYFSESILIANNPSSPTGNYIGINKNAIQCYGSAGFAGPLTGNASTATSVQDYGDTSKSIYIGWTGTSLTSSDFLAAYSSVNGTRVIKDIAASNVAVGRATNDGSGNNIVNTYQKRIGYSQATTTYSVTIGASQVKSIGNRSSSQAGFAYGSYGTTTLVDVEFDVSFTSPAGGYALGFYLSSTDSTSGAIDSQTIVRWYSAQTNVFERIHLCKVPASAISRLYILILNGTGSSISFTVFNIKLKIITGFTSAATSM